MQSFFSPHSKRKVSRPVALVLNSANMLGPALLFMAVVLLFAAAFGDFSQQETNWLNTFAGILIAAAILLRIVWGIAISVIRRKTQNAADA